MLRLVIKQPTNQTSMDATNFNGSIKLFFPPSNLSSFILLAYRGQRDIVIRCSRPVKLLYVRNKLRCKKKRKSVYPSGRSCFRGGGLERYLTDVRARYKYWGRVHRFTVVFFCCGRLSHKKVKWGSERRIARTLQFSAMSLSSRIMQILFPVLLWCSFLGLCLR